MVTLQITVEHYCIWVGRVGHWNYVCTLQDQQGLMTLTNHLICEHMLCILAWYVEVFRYPATQVYLYNLYHSGPATNITPNINCGWQSTVTPRLYSSFLPIQCGFKIWNEKLKMTTGMLTVFILANKLFGFPFHECVQFLILIPWIEAAIPFHWKWRLLLNVNLNNTLYYLLTFKIYEKYDSWRLD